MAEQPQTTSASSSSIFIQEQCEAHHREARQLRAKKTNVEYDRCILHWKSWCQDKDCDDGELVSVNKMIAYLRCVYAEGNKRLKNDDGTPKALSRETINMHLKACLSLYSTQKQRGENHYPHPRDNNTMLKDHMKSIDRKRADLRRKQLVDRGAATLLETYDEEEKVKLASHFFASNSGLGLRDRVGYLIMRSTMGRGQSIRHLQLADMWIREIPNEGPAPCFVLGLTSTRSKTNQTGRVEITGAMRHKDVNLCALGSVALWFFWQWEVQGLTPPNMLVNKEWYDMYFITAEPAKRGNKRRKKTVQNASVDPENSDSDKEREEEEEEEEYDIDKNALSYRQHNNIIKKALRACKIKSTKVTHLMRVCSSREAERKNVDSDQLSRMAGWYSGAKNMCYTIDLPLQTLRALADWPVEGRGYFLPREAIRPPDSLRKQIFKFVEPQKIAIDSSPKNIIAGKYFLRLLDHLRTVFLQDSVLLKEKHPNHPIWKHGIFQSAEYKRFEEQLLAAIATAVDPTIGSFQVICPEIANSIQATSSANSLQLGRVEGVLGSKLDEIARVQEDCLRVLRKTTELMENQQRETGLLTSAAAPLRNVVGAMAGVFRSPAGRSLVTQLESFQGDLPVSGGPESGEEGGVVGGGVVNEPAVGDMKMDRKLETVESVWREYEVGLGGNPSVRLMNELHGAKWRNSVADRKCYSRRKILYDHIKHLMTRDQLDGETIARRLDNDRQKNLDGTVPAAPLPLPQFVDFVQSLK